MDSLYGLSRIAPRPSTVREIADLLLAARGSTPPPLVGKDWVTKFVKRHPILSSRFSKGYNYERAKCEDPKIIEEWFNLVQKTILKYGIDPDNIYNFDKTRFTIGLIATAKVVTRLNTTVGECFYSPEIARR